MSLCGKGSVCVCGRGGVFLLFGEGPSSGGAFTLLRTNSEIF